MLMIEGAFYVWTRREFDEILGDDANIATQYWYVQEDGNVDSRHDIQGELEEQVILLHVLFDIECVGNGDIVSGSCAKGW